MPGLLVGTEDLQILALLNFQFPSEKRPICGEIFSPLTAYLVGIMAWCLDPVER
jgi:hypothetical protein